MALPTVRGRGFLISDTLELKFSQAGNAWMRLPLSFKNSRKGEDGTWSHDREILIEAMAFGAVAEFLNDNVEGRQDISVTGELYLDSYQDKTGQQRTSVKMNVTSAAPVTPIRSARAATPVDDGIPF